MRTPPVLIYVRPPAGDSRQKALACLRAYAVRFGLPPPRGLELQPGGKPVAVPGGLHLSVSHSGGLWACAVHTAPLGLDIQLQEARRPQAAIARRWFTPEEQALLAREPERFYPIWCAKEAWVKYTGAGISGGFGGFSCVGEGALLETWEGARLSWLDLAPGYTACLWHGAGGICIEGA